MLDHLAANCNLPFTDDVFLVEGLTSFNWAKISRDILREVGDPPIAWPDPNAAIAMGLQPGPCGMSPTTPIASVLWDAGNLNSTVVCSSDVTQAIASAAQTFTGLNDSQLEAISSASDRALTVIWGPPGTGKTKTLAAFISGMTRVLALAGAGHKLLVCGPTYRAVEELVDRILSHLSSDATCAADVFFGYSQSHGMQPVPVVAQHVNVQSFLMNNNPAERQSFLSSISDPDRITILATTVHQSYKVPNWLHGTNVAPVFDTVVLDESSQIPVTKALAPFASLKSFGRVIIAGDHLQMPPIASLEAPVGSEYMVGSIQTYLLSRFAGTISTSDLTRNYRSNSALVDFARTIGYPQTLIAEYPETAIRLLQPLPTPGDCYPDHLPYSEAWADVLAIDRPVITLLHDDDTSSQNNSYEAKMVAGLVYSLRHSVSGVLDGRGAVGHSHPNDEEFWTNCVGIVTPHRAQRATVLRELRILFPDIAPLLLDGAVDTVEKFQGGERHVILISFGVGDGDVIAGEEAFLMQLERTNVAISRAMAKCIVIMPTSLAGHIPQDKAALQTAHALKGFVDDFCDQSTPMEIVDSSGTRAGKLRWR